MISSRIFRISKISKMIPKQAAYARIRISTIYSRIFRIFRIYSRIYKISKMIPKRLFLSMR